METSREDLVNLVGDPAAGLDHPEPVIRRMAASNLSAAEARRHVRALEALASDSDADVRSAAIEALGRTGLDAMQPLITAGSDESATVRESAATAAGAIGDPAALDWLIEAAREDPDRAVREAAVAALGSIGDDRAVVVLLELMADGPPTVRRRAIAAITVFDDPRIEPAIRRAALDRNPGVRETAEMVVGRQIREV